MTADVPFSRPRHPSELPGDAVRAPRELMDVPGRVRDDRTWRLVWIRTGGRWSSGILTVWRRLPNSRVWVAHVRWGEDDQWGWFLYDAARIVQVPEPPAELPGSQPSVATPAGSPR